MTEKQIRRKLSIYLDKHDFDFPLLDDMVAFAQEIATEVTKELEQEIAKLKKSVEYYRKEREFFIGEVEK